MADDGWVDKLVTFGVRFTLGSPVFVLGIRFATGGFSFRGLVLALGLCRTPSRRLPHAAYTEAQCTYFKSHRVAKKWWGLRRFGPHLYLDLVAWSDVGHAGHNYIGHNYIGHNYLGHNYIGNLISTLTSSPGRMLVTPAITI